MEAEDWVPLISTKKYVDSKKRGKEEDIKGR